MAFTVRYPDKATKTYTDGDSFAIIDGGVLKLTYTYTPKAGAPIRRTSYYSPHAWHEVIDTPTDQPTPGTEGMYN